MRLSLATNWDLSLLDKLVGTSVAGLYGQIWGDPLGGGRMAFFLPQIKRQEAAVFIAETRRKGLEFNYLINGTCMDNREFTKKGYQEIIQHLEWISSTGADMVTISTPLFIQIIKRYFPQLKVCVSSFARVQNLHMARHWESLGADKIILPEFIVRDFQNLRLIREGIRCELEVIANHSCLFYCPFDLHHRNMVSHASQEGHACGGFAVDSCKLACQRMKLLSPVELIKARWIRPEDLGLYEEIGIDCLKLVERFRGTDSLINIVNVYEQRNYSGNLANLLTLPQESVYLSPNLHLIQRTDLIDVQKFEEILSVLREPFTSKLFIDNTKLNGFINYFKEVDCLRTDCDQCGYCARVASRVITIDEQWREELLEKFDNATEILTTGEIAGYFRNQ